MCSILSEWLCVGLRYILLLRVLVMAGVTGLEPAASGVTGRRSNQLSYTPLERIDILNPWGSSCQERKKVVGDDGIEPPTLSV